MSSESSSYYHDLESVNSKAVYNQLPEYTRISRYSQYNAYKKRRETWAEQTDRVFKMHKVHFAKFLDNEKFMEAFEFAKDMVNKKKVLGSQRALQFGGPAVLNKHARIYNCFSSDTKFWTENGVRSFNQFDDGDDVVIRGKDKWMPAKVKKFGSEELFKLKVQKKNTVVEIFTTLNHRWIAKDTDRTPFSIKTTGELNSGDILQEMSNRTNITRFQMCPIGIQHGIVYGDGTYNKQMNNCQIKLCGDKTELSKYFFSERKDQETITGLPKNWKELPSLDMNKEYLYGFLAGWFATNGTVDKNGRLTITNCNKQTLEWLKTAFFKLDIMTGIISISRENSPFDNSSKPLFRVNIVKKNIPETFYINSKHLERYKPSVENSKWKVVSIETTDRKEDVWCVVEPEKEEFTLESGILTKNCAATYIDRPRVFQEIMFTLLCGVGIGFSVQQHHIAKLPRVTKPNEEDEVTYVIPDSIEGWSEAVGILMASYFLIEGYNPYVSFYGKNIKFDYSLIRPKGAPISHMGGKAPGPDGLKSSLEQVRKILDECVNNDESSSKLRSIQCYDILMHISDAVLSGGIRRSATLCLFSLDDDEMINAKTGDWYIKNPQRARSNNSALLLRDQIPEEKYMKLIESVKQFGEPGLIFADSTETLYNPCVEISLYGYDEKGISGIQFCNLSEINMGDVKDEQDFFDRCRAASILGTFQAAYTDFGYLGEVTRSIVEREALIGVSMTGMMETPGISFSPEILSKGANIVKATNAYIASIIGIKQAARTTCVKPAGSTSCILGTSSGIHPCHAKRYFRRVQSNKTEEPLAFFKQFNNQAVDKSVWSAGGTDDVITFLCKSKKDSLTKEDVSAIDLLKKVKLVQTYWVTEGRNDNCCVQPWLNHNVSNTITMKPEEWEPASQFIYENRSYFAGISMLGDSGDMTYQQAPFQAVYTHEEIAAKYGAGSVFASGLIVHAHAAFNNNLYDACSALLGYGEKLNMPEFDVDNSVSFIESDAVYKKIRWVAQAKKFAKRHFGNDLLKMTYCLKAVDAWKTWCDLKRTYKEVIWEDFYEENDNTKQKDYVACSGNSCEIVSF